MCSIINFQGLIGSSYTVKSKRKNIVKDTLDIALIHNNYLKKSSYLTNRDKYTHQFGINKNISDKEIIEYIEKNKNTIIIDSVVTNKIGKNEEEQKKVWNILKDD